MFFSKIDGRILLKLDKNNRLSIKRQKRFLHLIVTLRHFNKLRRLCRLRHFTMLRCLRLIYFATLQRLAFSTLRRFCRLRHFSKLIFFVDFNVLATLGMFCKMSKSTKPSKRAYKL